ncbi:agip40 [Agrotis ipsilon multiple nucleopolyhedrovirus]|uniref:Uncharacterized protein n=1 Tax=Agrotis ipsilon multiple nucleopolyhedrovirus TaxID=208013 RepID=B6D5V4_9ABAC|nr:agip40 [Agrotis ipsilon multiple nucleopolyhedrovirus]ACI28742.1 unknown [Agrotis ipsilon multiple nucleopolyhedrovirus]
MRIGVYTVALTSVASHNADYIDVLLRNHFCPVFAVHGIVDTLAVCEDNVYVDNNVTTFKYYENFLQSPLSDSVAVTIQEHGDLDQKVAMVEKIVRVMRDSGGVIVLSHYY